MASFTSVAIGVALLILFFLAILVSGFVFIALPIALAERLIERWRKRKGVYPIDN